MGVSGEGGGSIGLKLLHDFINGAIHSSIFMYICVNLSFCFITELLFVLLDLYGNIKGVKNL